MRRAECPVLSRGPGRRGARLAQWLGAVLAVLTAAAAAAQSLPWREAPIIEPHQVFTPPPTLPRPPPPTPEGVVQLFVDACVQHEGVPAAVVDWALAAGFEPLDPLRADARELLGGTPGTALAAPASDSQVILGATADGKCVLWVDRLQGPTLRLAFQSMVNTLSAKGVRMQLIVSRNVQGGDTWRHQSQWRYRRVGGYQDFGLGSATTLVDAPGTQLLHFAPIDPRPAPDPDGIPRR